MVTKRQLTGQQGVDNTMQPRFRRTFAKLMSHISQHRWSGLCLNVKYLLAEIWTMQRIFSPFSLVEERQILGFLAADLCFNAGWKHTKTLIWYFELTSMIRRRSSCGFVDDEGTSDDQANQHCPGEYVIFVPFFTPAPFSAQTFDTKKYTSNDQANQHCPGDQGQRWS